MEPCMKNGTEFTKIQSLWMYKACTKGSRRFHMKGIAVAVSDVTLNQHNSTKLLYIDNTNVEPCMKNGT